MTRTSRSQLIRLPILGITLWLTIISLWLNPQAGQRSVRKVVLPEKLILADWTWLNSQAIVPSTTHYEQVVVGRHYNYQRQGQTLAIEIRYLINSSGGPLTFQSRSLDSQPQSLTVQQQPAIGFYSLYTQHGQLHLSSCINANGGTTATTAQFWHNRYAYDLVSPRLIAWALGQTSLLDTRCLWLHLSTAIAPHAPQQPAVLLQQVWADLARHWQATFPAM